MCVCVYGWIPSTVLVFLGGGVLSLMLKRKKINSKFTASMKCIVSPIRSQRVLFQTRCLMHHAVVQIGDMTYFKNNIIFFSPSSELFFFFYNVSFKGFQMTFFFFLNFILQITLMWSQIHSASLFPGYQWRCRFRDALERDEMSLYQSSTE